MVLVIADDLGVDALQAYADINGVDVSDRDYPATPTIDRICREGVRFTQAWAMPTCTPTRGSILTGRYGFRTGLDGVGRGKTILKAEITLPKILDGVANTANVGKWHLGEEAETGGLRTPNEMGWDHYAGAIGNLDGYFSFTKVVDGREVKVDNYATTETVDDAIAWATKQPTDASWLLWVAFNAPHGPFHNPPDHLHQHDGTTDPAEQYDAAVEALDTELGRLLRELPADVDVIVIGDNGSPARSIRAPLNRQHSKGTLYQGGVHVPLCIAGPQTNGARSEAALVSSVDLFATAANLLGVTPPQNAGDDSVSLTPYLRGTAPPQRTFVYSEQNRTHERNKKAKNVGGKTIRDARYKLIAFEDGTTALYDLERDPNEQRDLSASATGDAAAAMKSLRAAMDQL
ncbi:MAG: sulfatase-like hydrolase/transferase [Myxococcota bacterium]